MATSLNTDVIYPLSGETIICPDNQTTTYTTSGAGIVYLLGNFNNYQGTISLTINSRAISFFASTWADTKGSTPLTEYPLQVNLLTPTIRGSSGSGINYANHPGSPTDRNQGAYLPIKKGDVISINPNINAEAIASFLYF
jgi:hypothetical protein